MSSEAIHTVGKDPKQKDKSTCLQILACLILATLYPASALQPVKRGMLDTIVMH